jgi:hypothetical protein
LKKFYSEFKKNSPPFFPLPEIYLSNFEDKSIDVEAESIEAAEAMHISGIQVIRILRNASGMRDCRTKFRL